MIRGLCFHDQTFAGHVSFLFCFYYTLESKQHKRKHLQAVYDQVNYDHLHITYTDYPSHCPVI